MEFSLPNLVPLLGRDREGRLPGEGYKAVLSASQFELYELAG
jgi:hypothetical protein